MLLGMLIRHACTHVPMPKVKVTSSDLGVEFKQLDRFQLHLVCVFIWTLCISQCRFVNDVCVYYIIKNLVRSF